MVEEPKAGSPEEDAAAWLWRARPRPRDRLMRPRHNFHEALSLSKTPGERRLLEAALWEGCAELVRRDLEAAFGPTRLRRVPLDCGPMRDPEEDGPESNEGSDTARI